MRNSNSTSKHSFELKNQIIKAVKTIIGKKGGQMEEILPPDNSKPGLIVTIFRKGKSYQVPNTSVEVRLFREILQNESTSREKLSYSVDEDILVLENGKPVFWVSMEIYHGNELPKKLPSAHWSDINTLIFLPGDWIKQLEAANK